MVNFTTTSAIAQKESFDTNLTFKYLPHLIRNETNTSFCKISTLPLSKSKSHNVVCNVKEITKTETKNSFTNIFFVNKVDTLIFNIHHSAKLKLPSGTYSILIQRKGMGYLNKTLTIKDGQWYKIDLTLKPKASITNATYSRTSKINLETLVNGLVQNYSLIEAKYSCHISGLI